MANFNIDSDTAIEQLRGMHVDEERESESSKHCDAGYMNDVRFGDGGE